MYLKLLPLTRRSNKRIQPISPIPCLIVGTLLLGRANKLARS